MTTKDILRDFIVREVAPHETQDRLTDDLPLIENGVVDSLGDSTSFRSWNESSALTSTTRNSLLSISERSRTSLDWSIPSAVDEACVGNVLAASGKRMPPRRDRRRVEVVEMIVLPGARRAFVMRAEVRW